VCHGDEVSGSFGEQSIARFRQNFLLSRGGGQRWSGEEDVPNWFVPEYLDLVIKTRLHGTEIPGFERIIDQRKATCASASEVDHVRHVQDFLEL
jgi:hypothetical protein